LGVSFEVMIPDLEASVVQEREYNSVRNNSLGASWYDTYHTYAEITQHLRDLAASFPSLVTFVASFGTSVEGRAIPGIRVAGTRPTKKILYTGGQHAREWVSPATTLFVTEMLLTLYNTDSQVKQFVDNIEFLVIPLLNPDGYQFSWSSNRLWRKNRRNNGGSYGVDLNRNWDDHWCGQGASRTPSSDTYCGTAPFSEPETRSISTLIIQTGTYSAHIDFHSYSQLILRPYGWTTNLPPNSAELKLVGDTMSSAIYAVHSRRYTSEPSYQLYYTTGTIDDWTYAKAGIKLVYCIELRDTGQYGFQLPASQIIPTGEENFAAMRYLSNYVLTH